MKESHKLLIEAVKQQYLLSVSSLRGSAGPQEAFASWILGPRHRSLLNLDAAIHGASTALAASRSYKEVAVLGYGASVVEDPSVLLTPLAEGLEWLIGRMPFLQEPPSFEVDGTALLGIALGAQVCDKSEVNEWMAKFLKRSADMRISASEKCLIAASAAIIGNHALVPVPLENEVADLRVALSSRGIAELQLPDDCQHAMYQVLEETNVAQDGARSAARIRVLEWLSYETSLLTKENMTVEDVCSLLKRVPAAMKRWRWDSKTRWPIDDEYHVQDLLWIILAPLFPDLDDEESLQSIGHKHPRADLAIPSLHLIIEVKFVRKGTQASFANIIEQIAADHSLYLSAGSIYDKIIAFVWDDSSSTEQHEELRQGLQRMQGIAEAIIVPRPRKMRRD